MKPHHLYYAERPHFFRSPSLSISSRLIVLIVALTVLSLTPSMALANDAFNGTWVFNKKRSDDLQDAMEMIRRQNQEEIDQREEEKAKRTQKVDIFGKNREWDDNRGRSATSIVPKLMRTLIGSEIIKIYFSRKLAISYDNKTKRLLTPNPNGRVYSATGAGLSNDAIGETLSYIDDNVLFIETRTAVGKIKERIDPNVNPGRLTITWNIKAPSMERAVEMTTVYDKQ